MNNILCVISGGQDSITCLFWALREARRLGGKVFAISYLYGQNHQNELLFAKNICEQEGVELKLANVEGIFKELNQSALISGGDVKAILPSGLPASFVPNRNQIFLTLAHTYAQRISATMVVTGVCQTDFSGYPDCRREFIDALEHTLNLGSGANIRIATPLMYLTKAETFKLAEELDILPTIVNKTMTCYYGNTEPHYWGMGCGDCPACQLRQKGFDEFIDKYKK